MCNLNLIFIQFMAGGDLVKNFKKALKKSEINLLLLDLKNNLLKIFSSRIKQQNVHKLVMDEDVKMVS